jgi:hypothetical protein
MIGPDRIPLLLKRSDLTGIDFLFVHDNQTTIDVYFLWDTDLHDPIPTPPNPPLPIITSLGQEDIRIYSTDIGQPNIPILTFSWTTVNMRDVLRIETAFPGDYSKYKLTLGDSHLDPYFNHVSFSFKANCPSDLDCAPQDFECPPEEVKDAQINYLARDFWSVRGALLDWASLNYPDWVDRLEADAGIMMTEVMSAMADEMAYYQDQVAREAYLETASQRRSLRRHARLVDYHLHEGLGANCWIWLEVASGVSGNVPAGVSVWASGDKGTRIDFEVGRGLDEVFANKEYAVDANLNTFEPHIWDEDQACAPVGTTDLYIKNPLGLTIQFDDQIEGLPGQIPGKWFLIETQPTNPAQPIRSQLIRATKIEAAFDPVLNEQLLHIHWENQQGLPFEFDLTVTQIRGNILPVSAGRTHFIHFTVGAKIDDYSPLEQQTLFAKNGFRAVPEAVERSGPDDSIVYLFSLPDSNQTPLTWLGLTPQFGKPEVKLTELRFDGGDWVLKDSGWGWRNSLIGANSSQSEDLHFTLDDGTWAPVVSYPKIGYEFIHKDYASGVGVTLRFGDGEFGKIPTEKSVFRVNYRLGNGKITNLAANTLTYIDLPATFITAVSNPVQGVGGVEPETPAELRQLAPEAFKSISYRAVRPEDYAEAVERLPWVQRAGGVFRWTGSWSTAFVTPDPKGTSVLSESRREDVGQQLNRFRQAGREAHILQPIYANIDMEIKVCILPNYYRGEVKERIMKVLINERRFQKIKTFFSPDNFTFGTPLNRSTLEATIHSIVGVQAVEKIRFRRRGWFDWKVFSELSYHPGDNVIIRIENDLLDPGKGTLRIITHGGV